MEEDLELDGGGGILTDCELDAKYRNPKCGSRVRMKNKVRSRFACTGNCCAAFLKKRVPILDWLPKYNVKNNAIGDLAAGVTVGIVHIPQGLAYAQLASLPLVVGLYVSIFPGLLYPIFGSSRHVSMGTFAIVSILVSDVLSQHVSPDDCQISVISQTTPSIYEGQARNTTRDNSANFTTSPPDEINIKCLEFYNRRKIEFASALSICVGVIQVAMHVFHLGIITVFLSESMLSGFLCGASYLVITSQVPKLFGLTISRHNPPFAIVYTYVEIFENISQTNVATLMVSLFCIIFLVVGKEINQRFKAKLRVPIPWELCIVVISTAVSHFTKLNVVYGVENVGHIPKGVSTSVPQGQDIVTLFVDAIPIAIVAFAVEISLCQIFATKHSYEVDSNQELLALGICNIFGAFFSCFPSAPSLSRSVIYEEVGAKTQLGAFISSTIVLSVLLWMGPLFQSLPQAALAAIIIVNIKNVALLWKKVKPLWKISRLDAITWVVSWCSVIILGVPSGLLFGTVFSLLTVLLRTRNASGISLRKVSRDGVYRDVRKYSTVPADSEIFVYQFTGPLFFANKDRFVNKLVANLGYDPAKEFSQVKAHKKEIVPPAETISEEGVNASQSNPVVNGNGARMTVESTSLTDINSVVNGHRIVPTSGGSYCYVIFDMSRCSFLDSDGAMVIRGFYDAFLAEGKSLMLASCTDSVRKSLKGCWEDRYAVTYVSLESAIKHAQNQLNAGNGCVELNTDVTE